MADQLVEALNKEGYQPIFIPVTNLAPPDIYSMMDNKNLVRWGDLEDFLTGETKFNITSGQAASIRFQSTSSKSLKGAVGLLKRALQAIGIPGGLSIDLSCATEKQLYFEFENVDYQRVDPAELRKVIQTADFYTGVTNKNVDKGLFHVAYEYLYSDSILMKQENHSDFDFSAKGEVTDYIKVETGFTVKSDKKSEIKFKATGGRKAAFAYRSAQILKSPDHADDLFVLRSMEYRFGVSRIRAGHRFPLSDMVAENISGFNFEIPGEVSPFVPLPGEVLVASVEEPGKTMPSRTSRRPKPRG
jgi:hypothetical protein